MADVSARPRCKICSSFLSPTTVTNPDPWRVNKALGPKSDDPRITKRRNMAARCRNNNRLAA